SNVIHFDFRSNEIRVVDVDGNPWFVGADIRRALGLVQNGKSYANIGDDEKTMRDRVSLGMSPGRPVMLISESGLYKIIMRSDKPEARVFQDWVTRDVLPAIRKDVRNKPCGFEPQGLPAAWLQPVTITA